MSEKHNTKNHKIESIEPMILMSASGADVNGSDSGEILIAFGTATRSTHGAVTTP